MKNKHCPICNNRAFILKDKNANKFIPPEHKKYFAGGNLKYDILKCGFCGLEFQDPMPTREVLKSLYGKTYANPRVSEEIAKLNSKKNIKLLKKYGLSGKSKLMDFGSGAENHFVKTGNTKNWHGYDPYLNLTETKGGGL